MKKRLISLALAAAMMLTMVTGCAKEVDGSETVAVVGGEEISLDVANFYARYQQSQYETYYASFLGEDMWATSAETGVNYEESVKADIMYALQTMYVLRQHAEEYGVVLTDAEKEEISETAKNFLESNGLDAKEAISADQETVEEILTLFTIQTKMYDAMVADVNRAVSDEEAAQKSMEYVYFAFSKTDDEGATVEFTDAEKTALKTELDAFVKEVATADDFATLAEGKGYEVLTATFDAETTVPSTTVIEAADKLGEGEVSAVIEDESGYYVVKLTSLLDRDATDIEKETIIIQREGEQYSALCAEWMEATEMEVVDSIWDTVDFEKLGVTIKDATTEE